MLALHLAAEQGLGITPISDWVAGGNSNIQCLFKAPQQWDIDLWLVTHRDMHRTAKVQAFTQFIKSKLSRAQKIGE